MLKTVVGFDDDDHAARENADGGENGRMIRDGDGVWGKDCHRNLVEGLRDEAGKIEGRFGFGRAKQVERKELPNLIRRQRQLPQTSPNCTIRDGRALQRPRKLSSVGEEVQ